MGLDVPVRASLQLGGEIAHTDVCVGVERTALVVDVDRGPHRLRVVADHEERPTGRDGGEDVVDHPPVGRAMDRGVVRRHEVERGGLERVEIGCVGVESDDVEGSPGFER